MSFTSVPAAPAARWRDVYLVSAAKVVSVTGDFLAATALALTLQTRGEGGWAVAALFAAATVPMAVLAPLGGRLADRWDSRAVLVAVPIAQAGVCAALAFTDQPATLVALVALLSCGVAVTQPTANALIPAMVARDGLPRAMAISQTAGAVGLVSGPVLGAFLVAGYGTRVPLLIDAASFLAISVAAALIRTRRGGRARATADVANATDAWRLRDDRLLLTLTAALVSVVGAVTAVEVAEIFFVRETLGASEVMYGVVSSAWTLGMLVGAWPFGRLRGGDRGLVVVALSLLATLCAIVAASAAVPSAPWLGPLYLCGGVLNAGLNVMAGVVAGRRVPAEARGRVFGRLGGLTNAATVLGYGVGGALLQVVDPRTVIAVAGLAGLVVAALFLVPMVTSVARREVPAEDVVAVSYVGKP
jgi:MFS family permease